MNEVWEELEERCVEGAAALAELTDKECRRRMVARLQRLRLAIQGDTCPRQADAWIYARKRRPRGAFELRVSEHAPARYRGFPAIPLKNLSQLADGALLSFSVLVDRRKDLQAQYTVAIQGSARDTGEAWYARLEIDGLGQGTGRCGHPLLHLQTGTDSNASLQVRGPLPWLMPWEALDWLLATVDERLEPCPHP